MLSGPVPSTPCGSMGAWFAGITLTVSEFVAILPTISADVATELVFGLADVGVVFVAVQANHPIFNGRNVRRDISIKGSRMLRADKLCSCLSHYFPASRAIEALVTYI